jgi:hypothetical protein
LAAQSLDLSPRPGNNVGPIDRCGQGGHWLAFCLGEITESFESLEGEVPDVPELGDRSLQELCERQSLAKQIEIDEIPAGTTADDGAQLHEPEVDG